MVKDFFDTLDVNSSGYFRQVSGDGMVRLIREIPNGDILQAMFRGARNSDWLDEMNAPIDTEKVDLKSDVRRVIRSGNDSATVRHINHWYQSTRILRIAMMKRERVCSSHRSAQPANEAQAITTSWISSGLLEELKEMNCLCCQTLLSTGMRSEEVTSTKSQFPIINRSPPPHS